MYFHGNIGNKNAIKLDKPEGYLNIRCEIADKKEWKEAAIQSGGLDLTKWVIKILNEAAEKELYR